MSHPDKHNNNKKSKPVIKKPKPMLSPSKMTDLMNQFSAELILPDELKLDQKTDQHDEKSMRKALTSAQSVLYALKLNLFREQQQYYSIAAQDATQFKLDTAQYAKQQERLQGNFIIISILNIAYSHYANSHILFLTDEIADLKVSRRAFVKAKVEYQQWTNAEMSRIQQSIPTPTNKYPSIGEVFSRYKQELLAQNEEEKISASEDESVEEKQEEKDEILPEASQKSTASQGKKKKGNSNFNEDRNSILDPAEINSLTDINDIVLALENRRLHADIDQIEHIIYDSTYLATHGANAMKVIAAGFDFKYRKPKGHTFRQWKSQDNTARQRNSYHHINDATVTDANIRALNFNYHNIKVIRVITLLHGRIQ